MKRDEINEGDVVTVAGYGGFAEVLNIIEDGVGPKGTPKYRVTIKWGPNNSQYGTAKRSILVEDYPLGRLEPAETKTSEKRLNEVDDMDEAALIARLAQLKAMV